MRAAVLILTPAMLASAYLGATFAMLLPVTSPLWAPVAALARLLTESAAIR